MQMPSEDISSQGYEWELDAWTLDHIFHIWDLPKVYFFATAKKKKFAQLCSRGSLGHHFLGDAFLLHWDCYIFSPNASTAERGEQGKIGQDQGHTDGWVPT